MAGTLKDKLGGMFSRKGKGKDEVTGEVVKREENSREAVIAELRQGYGQLVDTMDSVQRHMAEQSERGDRMMEVIEQLPEVLRAIPDATQRQNETLAGLAQSLQTQNHSTGELTHALSGLADATRQQEQSLTDMHDRLHGTLSQTEAVNHEMASGIDKMSGAIEGVHEDQRNGRAVLAEIAGQSRRQQKQMLAMTSVSWVLAIAAMCVAAYVALMVTKASNTPMTGRDVPAAGAADGDTATDEDAAAEERDLAGANR